MVNDLDIDFTENPAASNSYQRDARNIRKIQEATQNLQVNIIHPLRPGKKLLVLDIDYSAWNIVHLWIVTWKSFLAILDTKPLTSGSLPPLECARPGLHEFLEAIYPHYDSEQEFLVFRPIQMLNDWSLYMVFFGQRFLKWRCPNQYFFRSQTSWMWLEAKLVELGMVGAQRAYQVSIWYSSRAYTDVLPSDFIWSLPFFPLLASIITLSSSGQDMHVYGLLRKRW